MSHLLYQLEESTGVRTFSAPQKIELSGNEGPIARLVKSCPIQGSPEILKWHATEFELKKCIDECKGCEKNRAIVIDLKPDNKKMAHMYLLKAIWGYTDEFWTPVMLHLEELSVVQRSSAEETKKSFEVDKYSDYPVLEFLYLNGGLKKSGWSWGPSGYVNGALLYPEVFEYFASHAPKKSDIGK